MYLNYDEKEARYESLRRRMKKAGVDALVVVGMDTRGGTTGTGSFRYLTDFFIIFNYGVLLFFLDRDPILLVTSELQKEWAQRHSWVKAVYASLDIPETAASILRDTDWKGKTIGLSGLEHTPARLNDRLTQTLTEAEVVDCSQLLFEQRWVKSPQEQELIQRAAHILDQSYEEVTRWIRPGLTEYEVVGKLEGFHREHGFDQTFNLISSGPFPENGGRPFVGLPWYPSTREIQKGDVIVLEMTGSYAGYWAQLVRTVSLGVSNDEVCKYHEKALASLHAGVGVLKKGATPRDVAEAFVAGASVGEELFVGPPFGHFVGLDLVEARVSPDSLAKILPGVAVIIHPTIKKKGGPEVIFWGQTYIVCDEGPVSLSEASDEFKIL